MRLFPKLKIEIKKGTKCLVVAPHADDEAIGLGGTMLKYKGHFDCLCVGSSGIAYKEITPKERSDMRIKEFEQAMKFAGVENYWIMETYGKQPFMGQIKKYFKEYLKVLEFKQYDYIFMPHPKDGHVEHMFITNRLMKWLFLRKGFSLKTKIVFYEVWTPMALPNHYEDISNVIEEKKKMIGLYKSQLVVYDYVSRAAALSHYRGTRCNNAPYAEAFKVSSILTYLLWF